MRIRRLILTVVLALTATATTIAGTATPAIAGTGQEFLGQITGVGTPEETLLGVESVSVDDKTGDVLLPHVEMLKEPPYQGVAVFDPSLKYKEGWRGFGSKPVVVDQATGDVYVTSLTFPPGAQSAEGVLNVLDSAGKFVNQITSACGESFNESLLQGVTIDQSTRYVYVIREISVGTFTSFVIEVVKALSGECVGQITEAELPKGTSFVENVTSLAVDETAHMLFVAAPFDGAIFVFSTLPGFKYMGEWRGAKTPAESFVPRVSERGFYVAFDRQTSRLLVADAVHGVIDELVPKEVENAGAVKAVEEYRGQITEIPCVPGASPCGPIAKQAPQVEGLRGVGVDDATGDIYISQDFEQGSSATNPVVDVLGPPPPAPVVSAGVPSGVSAVGATLNGLVNPEGLSLTECRFEYVTQAAYKAAVEAHAANPYGSGFSAPCAQGPSEIGNGKEPVPVSVSVGNLTPGTEYHYQLTAVNLKGLSASSGVTRDQRLVTAPTLTEGSASGVTQFGATVSAGIEPGEAPSTYHFLYWPEGSSQAAGQLAPIPDVSLPVVRGQRTVSQALSGLQAGTTYHFKLVASSAAGTFEGPEGTFATPGIPAPSASTGGASGLTVGSATLSGSVDPHGWPTTYEFQYGPTTAYGASWPTVPVELGALEGAQPVSVEVQNLLPATVYHFRLVAASPGGVAYGADGTFTTAAYPQALIQEPAVLATFLLPTEAKSKPLTRAQRLARALSSCRRKYKNQKSKSKRTTCERQARKSYAPKSKASDKNTKASSKTNKKG